VAGFLVLGVLIAVFGVLALVLPSSPSTTTPSPESGAFPITTAVPPSAALRLADRLLASAILPAGSRPVPSPRSGPLTAPLGFVATPNIADRHALWTVPTRIDDVAAFLKTHLPPAMKLSSWSAGGTDPTQSVVQELSSPGRDVHAGFLWWSITPTGPATSLLRLDAEVLWLPARSPGELVAPSDAVAALTWQQQVFGPPPTVVSAQRTVSDAATVARLRDIFNDLQSDLPGARSCTMFNSGIKETAAFSRTTTDPPDVVATVVGGCSVVTVTVQGKAATTLHDDNRLGPTIDQLLGKG
jgi:hypothetical protein